MGQSKSRPEFQRAQWEWKSNPNPFSTFEQPQWTAYPPLDNFRLEDALSENKSEVDLGNYIVSLKDMLQKSKENNYKQRPVRRNTEYFNSPEETKQGEEENIRGNRFFGVETPKTKNQMFGKLSDYLGFFEKRGPEIKEFANLFQEVEATKDLDQLNKKIIPCLINSMRTESKKKSDLEGEQKLVTLFEKEITSIEDFYGRVLKAYTIDCFLYKRVNKYLREVNWIDLHCLLPYVYCLCKAFFHPQFTSPPQINISQRDPMILYRGASISEDDIHFYNVKTTKYFAWNSMTSTSRIRRIGEKFSYSDRSKTPVLFLIEVPQSLENTKSANWIDIKPFSAIPKEDEVLLPPGSVFELKGVNRYRDYAEIHLRLVSNGEKLVHFGQILHGAMHSEMAKDQEMKIVCLEGEELLTAISHLKGNELIEELEFCSCKFNKKILTSFAETLKTIPKLRKLVLISPSSSDQTHFSLGFELLKDANIQIQELEIDDQTIFSSKRVFDFSKGISCFPGLQSLNLDFSFSMKTNEKGIIDLCSQGIRNLTLLQSLTLNFNSCQGITDEEVEILCFQGIKYLKSLTSLNLHFVPCWEVTSLHSGSKRRWKITDKGLHSCSQVIQQLGSLASLALDFGGCGEITDEGLNYLCSQGIQHLTQLQALSLSFQQYEQITDLGLNSLYSSGIQRLTALTSLTLNFCDCKKITYEGVENLCEGINNISSLKFLIFDFNFYENIIEKWVRGHIVSKSWNSWSLHLDLESCKKMTHGGIKSVRSQIDKGQKFWILNLSEPSKITIQRTENLEPASKVQKERSVVHARNEKQLIFKKEFQDNDIERSRDQTFAKDLDHNFEICIDKYLLENSQTPSPGHEALANQSLFPIIEHVGERLAQDISNISSVTSFILKINGDSEITDEVLNDLSLFATRHSTSLTSLTLSLQSCEKVTAKGLNKFWHQGFHHLTSLASLSVSLSSCKQVTDEAMKNLCSQWIKPLTSLTSLELNFSYCDQLTDQGLILYSQGFHHLTSLTSLSVSFNSCEQVTDFGLDNLGQGLKDLTLLTSLALNFVWCKQITDDGLSNLCSKGIQSLTSLTSLTLNFSGCSKITDKGLDSCSQGIKHLASLTILALHFFLCEEITEKGLEVLCSQGIKNKVLLTSLTLDFGHCKKITDEGLFHIGSKGIKYLKSLQSLNLSFLSCGQITSNGLDSFSAKGLKHLKSLTSLTLDFGSCTKITDSGLDSLSSKGIRSLTALTFLAINLGCCFEITDNGLEKMCSQGIKHLTSLTSLTLQFFASEKITDRGLNHLCSQGIKVLTSLESLSLTFVGCEQITDVGLNILCSQGIGSLSKLTSLTLYFDDCPKVTGKTCRNFKKVLKYFGYQPFRPECDTF